MLGGNGSRHSIYGTSMFGSAAGAGVLNVPVQGLFNF